MKIIRTIDCAWAAGFFDGEGNLHPYKVKSGDKVYEYLQGRITQVDRASLERLVYLFGGTIWKRKLYKHYKQTYEWSITGRHLLFFCKVIQDMTIVKKNDILEAIKWLESRSYKNLWNL